MLTYISIRSVSRELDTKIYTKKAKVNPHNKFRDFKTIEKFKKTRIKNEIKFWYTKKQNLNKKIHLALRKCIQMEKLMERNIL
jgi:hypothetical protein